MKLLYLTVPSFFDLDVSLIRELSKICEVKVVMFLTPVSMKMSAFSIDTIDNRCDIIQASQYPQLSKYNGVINLRNWYIANNPTGSMLDMLKLTRKVNSFIHKENPDVIHYTNFIRSIYGSILCTNSHSKKIITIHDPESHAKQKLINRFFKYSSMRIAKNVLLLSEPPKSAKEKISKYSKQVFRSSLGIYDILDHSSDIAGTFQLPDKYILFFGRIQPYKGVDILIDSFLSSSIAKKGYKLVIAGSGEISCPATESIVLFNRYISNDELSALIERSALVVLPYRSATQSGVIMSAFAKYKPVIATDVGNFREILENGKYGELVAPADSKSLTHAIDTLVEDKVRLNYISQQIKQDFGNEGKYGWKRIAEDLVSVYDNLV